MIYRVLRNLHLAFAMLALPFLLMYGISAVQMAHGTWFNVKPEVIERSVSLEPGITDSRQVVRRLALQGDLRSVQASGGNWQLRFVIPGTVHDVRYDSQTGVAHIKTSRSGFMGMINRLHHAGGMWADYMPLKLWGAAVGIVSLGTVGLAITGIWMWWLRKKERRFGLIVIVVNVVFAITVLAMMRAAGP